MQQEINSTSSLLEKGYEVVVKIAEDIDKLKQRSVELAALLKNKESVVHDIQKGINILGLMARSIHCDGIDNNSLPTDCPTDHEIFVKSISKRLKIQMDSQALCPLFQKKGFDWFHVWDRISVEYQQYIASICDTLLPNYWNLLDELRTKTEATRKEHFHVANEISKKIARIKKYQYYATKAFKVGANTKSKPEVTEELKVDANTNSKPKVIEEDGNHEAKRKRRTEMVENVAVSLVKKKQKTYEHVETLMSNDYIKRLKAKLEGTMEDDFVSDESSCHLISCLRSIMPPEDEDSMGNSSSHRMAMVLNVVHGISKSSSYFFESESDIPTTPG
jgi:hypothetical protein